MRMGGELFKWDSRKVTVILSHTTDLDLHSNIHTII